MTAKTMPPMRPKTACPKSSATVLLIPTVSLIDNGLANASEHHMLL